MKRLAAFLLAALTLTAQDWRYELLNPVGPLPAPRVDGTITYHAETATLYLFGGSAQEDLNDLWAYSLQRNMWRKLEPLGTAPPARLGHTLVTDAKRNRLVVFGGQARGFFSDVWAYEIRENRWVKLAADAAGPSNRYGHSGVYDPVSDRMIISHGFTNAGRFDDTWAFDFATNRWSNITPGNNRPLRRCLHHAVLDATGRQMYLYGGCASGNGPCPLGDLWSFDLNTNTWTEVTPASRPAGRQHYGFSFDSRRNRIVLQGGSSLSDTWLYDPASRIWSQLPTNLAGPARRNRHQGAYAAERGISFFFGGSTTAGLSNELWALSSGLVAIPTLARDGVVNAFSHVGGGVAPGEYISVYGDSLGPDTSVMLDGAPIEPLFASAEQVNLQIPFTTTTEQVRLRVRRGQEAGNELLLPVVAAHPGLFPYAVNQTGELNTASTPASPGAVGVLYATGQGRNPEVRLELNGAAAELLFAGPSPGAAGLLQINFRVPAQPGSYRVVLKIGSVESQAGVALFVR